MSTNPVYTTCPVHKVHLNNRINLDSGTPVEVFRNNTTAVEVIVKEIPNRSRKKEQHSPHPHKTSNVEDKRSYKLDESNESIEVMRKGFHAIISEMKRQLEEMNERNLAIEMKNLSLQLENHKLKTLLEYKTHYIGKLKKEFQNIKHSLKFVVKSLGYISKISDVTIISDTEYEDFANGLKKEVKFATFDGTLSSCKSRDNISEKND